jgi:hypothetical protein
MPERLVFRNVLAGIRRRSRCLAIRRLASLLEVFMLPDQGELITADRLAVSRGMIYRLIWWSSTWRRIGGLP